MMESKFLYPVYDGKADFTMWQCTMKDLLVRDNLDLALEEEKPEEITDRKWNEMQKNAVSNIRLSLAPNIKHNVMRETTAKGIWDKLQSIYASKSLTNRLLLKIDLYSLKMEEGGNLHDHINAFGQLVYRLQNTGEEVDDEEQALLLLSSLPKSYKPLVQTMLIGKTTLSYDETLTQLRENEKMMGKKDEEGETLAVAESSTRGRSRSKRGGGGDSRSRSRPRDHSNVECYYCGEKGHIQYNCSIMKEDLKSLRKSRGKAKVEEKDDSNVNLAYDDELLVMKSTPGYSSQLVLDCASSMHICKEKSSFDSLQVDEDFGHVIVGNGEKMKIEGVGVARIKTHNGVVKKLANVRFVPSCSDNIISLGELCSRGYKFVGEGNHCKVYKGDELVLQGVRSDHHIFHVGDSKNESCISLGIHREEFQSKKKKKKRVSFSDKIEVFGTLS